jgi:hypothetical protein
MGSAWARRRHSSAHRSPLVPQRNVMCQKTYVSVPRDQNRSSLSSSLSAADLGSLARRSAVEACVAILSPLVDHDERSPTWPPVGSMTLHSLTPHGSHW